MTHIATCEDFFDFNFVQSDLEGSLGSTSLALELSSRPIAFTETISEDGESNIAFNFPEPTVDYFFVATGYGYLDVGFDGSHDDGTTVASGVSASVTYSGGTGTFHFEPGSAFNSLDTGEYGYVTFQVNFYSNERVEHLGTPFFGSIRIEGVTDSPVVVGEPLDPTNVITFNDRAALRALPDQARREEVTNEHTYTEDGMTFRSGLSEPDPRLGGEAKGFYSLEYENDPDDLIKDAVLRGERVAAEQPRSLKSFGDSDFIELTYDKPDKTGVGDGVLDTFDLESIRVLEGKLNLGVMYADRSIAVYNDLTAGFNWTLIDATGLIRATLEAVGPSFTVDDIVLA